MPRWRKRSSLIPTVQRHCCRWVTMAVTRRPELHSSRKSQPKYAVISSGKMDEGMNTTYCHPRASTVTSATRRRSGGRLRETINAFDPEVRCTKDATPKIGSTSPANDSLWATERDGDMCFRPLAMGFSASSREFSRFNHQHVTVLISAGLHERQGRQPSDYLEDLRGRVLLR